MMESYDFIVMKIQNIVFSLWGLAMIDERVRRLDPNSQRRSKCMANRL
jgi:hypothetical protein